MGRLVARARTDFSVHTRDGTRKGTYRGIEVSSTGILIDRGRPVVERDQGIFINLEIRLPERRLPLFALARPVWSFGTQQAFKFVRMNDADRLSLAEHVDLQQRRSGVLQ
jgi:hypothetical protein